MARDWAERREVAWNGRVAVLGLEAGPEAALDAVDALDMLGLQGTTAHTAHLGALVLTGAPEAWADAACPDLARRLEGAPIPVVAALDGDFADRAAGLALAAHYRLASPRTRIGFPALAVGRLPEDGTTQRLPRLVGVAASRQIFLDGAWIGARAAEGLGLVDGVTRGAADTAALSLARRLVAAGAGPRPTAERRVDGGSKGSGRLLLTAVNTPVGATAGAATPGLPARAPALVAALEMCLEAAAGPFAAGCALEARCAASLANGGEARALAHLMSASKRLGVARRARAAHAATGRAPVETVAVTALDRAHSVHAPMLLGALARSGLDIVLIAPDPARLAMARARIARGEGALRGVLSLGAGERDLTLDFTPGAMSVRFRGGATLGLDLIGPGPVPRLGLVRCEAGDLPRREADALDVLADRCGVRAFVLDAGRHPVAAQLRVAMTAIVERLMEAGASPSRIDRAAEADGFSVGPCASLDAAGLSAAAPQGWDARMLGPLPWDAGNRAAVRWRDPRLRHAPIGARLAQLGHTGRLSRSGFHRYDAVAGTPRPSAAARDAAAHARSAARASGPALDAPAIVERLRLALLSEALRLQASGSDSGLVDLVAVEGFGWPAWQGGPLHWAAGVGAEPLRRRFRALATTEDALYWHADALHALNADLSGDRTSHASGQEETGRNHREA